MLLVSEPRRGYPREGVSPGPPPGVLPRPVSHERRSSTALIPPATPATIKASWTTKGPGPWGHSEKRNSATDASWVSSEAMGLRDGRESALLRIPERDGAVAVESGPQPALNLETAVEQAD